MALGIKTAVQRRFRDVVMHAPRERHIVHREDLARRYLAGDGIEIGAFAWRLRVPPAARVRYVDHAAREELIRLYETEFAQTATIPETDVVDDAQTLAAFADGSLDFVVASHVLEHLEDPVAALRSMLRVLRPGGVAFLILPDARHTFDAARERTTIEHLLLDHREGPERSRRGHYEEWARVIESTPADRVAARADEFAAQDARHHFHVWELDGFVALLVALDLPCTLELAQVNHEEFVVVLRRDAS
jgi:SAM-dependent methyltransferase